MRSCPRPPRIGRSRSLTMPARCLLRIRSVTSFEPVVTLKSGLCCGTNKSMCACPTRPVRAQKTTRFRKWLPYLDSSIILIISLTINITLQASMYDICSLSPWLNLFLQYNIKPIFKYLNPSCWTISLFDIKGVTFNFI